MHDPYEDLKKSIQIEQQSAVIKEAVEEIAECIPQISKLYFMYYTALVEAGFEATQALYLIGQHGSSLGVHFNK